MNPTAARASLTVAVVHGFFLLFAQFAYVELIRGAGIGTTGERALLCLMAFAGVGAGFAAAARGCGARGIRLALLGCALAAALATFRGGLPVSVVVALLTGASLGTATVSLAALLPGWCGLAGVGLGVGAAYAFCNLPPVFSAPPLVQAWIAAVLALSGAPLVPPAREWRHDASSRPLRFPAALAVFAALVWLDSAAFFIIQHSAGLKDGTWGPSMLWRNAGIHFLFAALAGWALARGWSRPVACGAWCLLAVAGLAVNHDSSRLLGGVLYPAGVSLYSAALVAWPGWCSSAADSRGAAWRAAWLFAIAGWFGSAGGIGMAQALERVPTLFVAMSGIVVIGILAWSAGIGLRALAVVALIGVCGVFAPRKTVPVASAAERGRQVYLAEGCIHCHSRYVRPGSPDESRWGRASDPDAVQRETPVLIGNRRQGPDLANIGARRSEAWLRAHFIDPRALSPGSAMPSYAHLFRDGRGEDLVRFLKESGVEHSVSVMNLQAAWSPAVTGERRNAGDLYARHCAVCHGADGRGGGSLAASLHVRPANLREGPHPRTGFDPDPVNAIARVIRFGVIGSDMPGHETLDDADIAALAAMLRSWR